MHIRMRTSMYLVWVGHKSEAKIVSFLYREEEQEREFAEV